jgi:hypothetical protein
MSGVFNELIRAELNHRPQAYRDVVDGVDWQSAVSEIAEGEELEERQRRHFRIECAAVIAFALEKDEPLSRKLSYRCGVGDLTDAERLARRFDEQILCGTLSSLRQIGFELAGESPGPERSALYFREQDNLKITSTTFSCGTLGRHISLVSRNEYARVEATMWGLKKERHEVFVDVESDRIGRHDDFVFTFDNASAAAELRDAVDKALAIERFRQAAAKAG